MTIFTGTITSGVRILCERFRASSPIVDWVCVHGRTTALDFFLYFS